MARAKNTGRADARRRYRDQTRSTQLVDDVVDEPELGEADAAAAPPSRGMFRMPDWRSDLRILPGMLATNRKLWIPFVMLAVAFVLALLLAQTKVTYPLVADGIPVASESGRIIPVSMESLAGLYVQLTLPPTALFVFFIGGFLAPRASYLVGALLGLVDGLLWSALFLLSPTAQPDASGRLVQPTDFITIVLVAVVVGTLAAGFAAWYRNFLRQSQERARVNRAAREQQAKLKAKEDARAARDAQRQAAAAARPPKPASASGTPAAASGSKPAKATPPTRS